MADHGKFSGEPQTTWLTEEEQPDRRMTLLADFWFDDPDQRRWDAPKEYPIDGASIPRALWTIVGSPYTGDYRRASVVHDKACDDAGGNSAKRRAADRMFFHACRAGGCSTREAIVLYIGVRIGAMSRHVPQWREVNDAYAERPRIVMTGAERQMMDDFQSTADRVLYYGGETDDITTIEAMTDEALSQVSGMSLRGL